MIEGIKVKAYYKGECVNISTEALTVADAIAVVRELNSKLTTAIIEHTEYVITGWVYDEVEDTSYYVTIKERHISL